MQMEQRERKKAESKSAQTRGDKTHGILQPQEEKTAEKTKKRLVAGSLPQAAMPRC